MEAKTSVAESCVLFVYIVLWVTFHMEGAPSQIWLQFVLFEWFEYQPQGLDCIGAAISQLSLQKYLSDFHVTYQHY